MITQPSRAGNRGAHVAGFLRVGVPNLYFGSPLNFSLKVGHFGTLSGPWSSPHDSSLSWARRAKLNWLSWPRGTSAPPCHDYTTRRVLPVRPGCHSFVVRQSLARGCAHFPRAAARVTLPSFLLSLPSKPRLTSRNPLMRPRSPLRQVRHGLRSSYGSGMPSWRQIARAV